MIGTKVDKVTGMDWILPDYLNIDWTKDFPEPYREITRDEFDRIRDHCNYTLGGVNFASVIYLPDFPEELRQGHDGWRVHYLFWHGWALALADKYVRYGKYQEREWLRGKGHFLSMYKDKELTEHTYGHARRFFKIGCDHNYRPMDQLECGQRGILHHGNCYHVYECTECGDINSYDSSG